MQDQIQKSIVFLWKSENKIKKTTLLTIESKGIKDLRINLTEEVQHYALKTIKTLLKEIKEDLNKWKEIPWLWILRLNIVKMSILPNWSIVLVKCPFKF